MQCRFIAWMRRRSGIDGLFAILSIVLAGCADTSQSKKVDNIPNDTVVITANQGRDGKATFKEAGDLEVAEDFYRREDWERAGDLFDKVAEEKYTPALHAERARFYEAECLRMRHLYPDAMSTYSRLLDDFQRGVFREKAVARMYEIAQYWLDDTRVQLNAELEKAAGKRWFVPGNFFHFKDKSKPLMDEEGHALKMLEKVYYNDPLGPYAEMALYSAGYVYFRRSEFKQAADLLTTLVENSDQQGRKSAFRDQAIELAILSKNNSSGGPDYDPRVATDSLKLIQSARISSPDLGSDSNHFLDNQTKMVRYMQAEKDYKIAEFYRRTGHEASAWFYYDLVRRRYAETEFHDKAVAHMKEINAQLAAIQKEPEWVKATRREWIRFVYGTDTPRLAKEQSVPAVPGVPELAGLAAVQPANPSNPTIQQAGAQQSAPVNPPK